ncbi:BgtAc-30847 [Blumeria graminis f. sp. tritici]|uniref:BgtAc-30847 n=2 Tax=Blumeria graminis f. sp. tritici TaxID=62690 RepID=A0A9X9MGX8_BLUGR|nr:hypothetical protein BGT96224_Ac30847 [Blumeria graminis f. sp. tritici 96224]VDB86393.1 BgtAc-30847 [Blumeria graminis f. sp. tritici]
MLCISVQMMAMSIQKINPMVLPVPNPKFNFKFKCGGVHQYEKTYLDLVVKTALKRLNSGMFYPAIFDEFTYAANGQHWIYPLLPSHEIYDVGLPIHKLDILRNKYYHKMVKAIAPDEFVVFDKKGMIVGGVQYVLGTNNSKYLSCVFADKTVFEPNNNKYNIFCGQADSSHTNKFQSKKKAKDAHSRKADVIQSEFDSIDSNAFSQNQDHGCNLQLVSSG